MSDGQSNGEAKSPPQTQLVLHIEQTSTGLNIQSPLPPGVLLSILLGVVEDVRYQAIRERSIGEQQRIQVGDALRGIDFSKLKRG